MANEIQLNIYGSVANGNFKTVFDGNGQSITQAAIGGTSGVLSLTTADTALGVGSVTSEGILFLKNTDLTNFFTWGPNNAGAILAIGKVLAGETYCFRLKPGVTFRLQADTATVKVQYLLLQA